MDQKYLKDENKDISLFAVQRWVPPHSKNEIWSNVMDPIGAIFGCKKTCVDYDFVPIDDVLWENGLEVRLVILWSEPDFMPHSQITYCQEFMNESVQITKVGEDFVEGNNDERELFRWHKKTFVLQKAPQRHASMIGSSLGPYEPCVCYNEFTFTVNRDIHFNEKQVKHMLEANKTTNKESSEKNNAEDGDFTAPTENIMLEINCGTKRERTDSMDTQDGDDEPEKRQRLDDSIHDKKEHGEKEQGEKEQGDPTPIATGTEDEMGAKQGEYAGETFVTPWGQ